MPGDRRAGAAEHAEHVNAAAGLLEAGMGAAEAARVLAHARASGRTISSVAVQALEEFLARAHGDRRPR